MLGSVVVVVVDVTVVVTAAAGARVPGRRDRDRNHRRKQEPYEECREPYARPFEARLYALKLQSFCPMNESGVPATIAIACAATFIMPVDPHHQDDVGEAER